MSNSYELWNSMFKKHMERKCKLRILYSVQLSSKYNKICSMLMFLWYRAQSPSPGIYYESSSLSMILETLRGPWCQRIYIKILRCLPFIYSNFLRVYYGFPEDWWNIQKYLKKLSKYPPLPTDIFAGG